MKKKLTVATMALVLLFANGFSQNRSITFVEKPWKEILTLAGEQNKMIFLDAYTSWCGPCKWMAANMFTKDTVADFYNRNFICAHFDMEKGEGVQLAGTYKVGAYPTLLFISPDGGIVHTRVGAPQKTQDYLDMATIALTPGEGLTACMKIFQEGNRDPEFMAKYLDRLQGAYMPFSEPLGQYFASQKEADLTSRNNWNIINKFLSDMDSPVFDYLVKHQKDFAALYTSDSVDRKIFSVCVQTMTTGLKSRSFTEENYEKWKQKIRSSGVENPEKIIFTGDLTRCQMTGDAGKFAELAFSGLDTYYGDDYEMLNRMAWHFFQTTTEVTYLEKASSWAKTSIGLKSTAENNNTYANLMFKLGNKAEAVKYGKVALEIALQENTDSTTYMDNLKKFGE